ncbi:MAG: PaaI family thioesterase [Actinomycetota bacterium]
MAEWNESLTAPDPGEAAEVANRLVREGQGGTMVKLIGLEYVELSGQRVVARIPVAPNTQPYGLLHGGATAALCETAASIGTAFAVGPEKLVTGIELNVNHLRAVHDGHVTVTAEPLHVGRTTAVWDMRVRDDRDRLVAVSRLTLAVRDPSPSP